MKKINANALKNYFDETIEFQGFVEKVRDLPYVQFLILRDKTGRVQVTIEKEEKNKELNQLVSSLTAESTIIVKGILKENEKVKLNGMELLAKEIIVTSKSLEELPVNLKEKNATLRDTRLDYRFLDLRREENRLLFQIATDLVHAMREYCVKNNYTEIMSPKITASNAESSGAEQFNVDYFGTKACLIQSPQFYKQMGIASGFDKVFETGPVFRAENSNTATHTTEFHGFDIEIGWIHSYEDVMDEEEAWIKYFLNAIKDKYEVQIKETFHTEICDTSIPFARISFPEVKRIMKEVYHYEAEKKTDLDGKEEGLISKYVKEKYHTDFVFVTNFPYEARSFYVMKDENGVTQTYDLIYKGIEITSGAQREHRPELLANQIKEKGLNPEEMQFYIDFFKYGCPPHGGFGVGIERILMSLLNIDNIREVAYIFRGPNRLNP